MGYMKGFLFRGISEGIQEGISEATPAGISGKFHETIVERTRGRNSREI